MKKLISVFCIVICVFCLFADVNMKKVLSMSSLYEENPFDPYGFNTEVHLVYLPVKAERSIKFVTYCSEGSETPLQSMALERFGIYNEGKSLYAKGKMAGNFSLFVTDFFLKNNHKLTMDLNVKGYIGAVFEVGGGADMLSVDGSFFAGPEFSLDDKLVFRAGLHHLSGHYGDEVLNEFERYYLVSKDGNDINSTITINCKEYFYNSMAEYVRDNEMLLGLQYNLPAGFSCYFEYAQPFHTSFVRPFYECPADHKTSTQESETVWEKLAWSEGINLSNFQKEQLAKEVAKYDKLYVAARIHTGFTWSKTWDKTQLFAGLDFQAHQDGQTKHILGEYSKYNSWEYELTLGSGVFFYDDNNHGLGLDVQYHWGRFPALNLFANRVNALYVGLLIK